MRKKSIQEFQVELEQLQIQIEDTQAELQLRAVLQTSIDAIIMSDQSGNILSWNKGAKTIFGYEDYEVLNQPLTILIPKEFQDAHLKGMERVTKSGIVSIIGMTVEVVGLKKNGTRFPIELSLSGWTIDGKPFYGGIIRDITERKQFEEKLVQSETDLQARNQMLEEVNQEIALKNQHLQILSSKLSKYLSPQV
ncbi:MAG: PAS domain S-box protein, partial [SAR324 cluster bacterium]|nr:PAS domain S-box protein [SAR324 cluster bacterium]